MFFAIRVYLFYLASAGIDLCRTVSQKFVNHYLFFGGGRDKVEIEIRN